MLALAENRDMAMDYLTETECSELARLEKVIDGGLKTFVEVGSALSEIRDNRLYRASHGTFEDYCRERWGMVASRARQLIGAAQAVGNLESVTTVTPKIESQVRPLVSLEPAQQREAWTEAMQKAESESRPVTAQDVTDAVYKLKPHVANNSGENEWYTPPEYIEAARIVLGGNIDLDPASSEIANREIIKADTFYTKENDGLDKHWSGNVWMNPPYASDLIRQFTSKFASHVIAGDIKTGIVLVNNATETAWFRELIDCANAVVFTSGRVRFLDPRGNPGAPLQGQALIYFGAKARAFIFEFKKFGWGAVLRD
jgi:phage N-6-adenine-methyltransferase